MKIGFAHYLKNSFSDFIDGLLYKLGKRATYEENRSGSKTIIKEISDDGILDKATILLTPTAYSNARLHSVKTYTGTELVTNGNFATDTDWTKGTGWTISGGTANSDGTQTGTSNLYQDAGLTIGTTYKATVTISNYSSGNIRIRMGGNTYGGWVGTDGETTFVAVQTYDQRAYLQADANFIGSVDNFSVKDVSSDFDFERDSSATRVNSDGLIQDMQSITDPELVENGDFSELGVDLVTDGDFPTGTTAWDLETGWSINNNKAYYDFSRNSSYIKQTLSTDSSKIYKISFTISGVEGGKNARFSLWNSTDGSTTFTGYLNYQNGTHTQYLSPTGNGSVLFFNALNSGVNDSSFSIDNISVKQVDPNDNWNFGAFWTISNEKANVDSTSTAALTQPITLIIGHVYLLEYDISNFVTGTLQAQFGGDVIGSTSANGHVSWYKTSAATSTSLYLYAIGTSEFSIDNVTLKDVTFSEDVDLPRIDYTGGVGHILLEPAATNSLEYSEDFTQYATSGTITLTAGYLAPDGTNSAYKIEGVIGSSYIYEGSVSGTTASRSIWAKTVSGTGVANLTSYNTNTNNLFTITEEWQRFELTGSSGSGGTNFYVIDFRGTTTLSELIVWGAQSELTSYVTSYIPTHTGITVTRDAETLDGSGNDTLIGQTEGVLYAEIAALANDLTERRITISDGGSTNRVDIEYMLDSNKIKGRVVNNSSGVGTITYTVSNITDYLKIALKYKTDDFALWINGTEVGTDTSGSTSFTAPLSTLEFANGSGSQGYYGKTKCLAVFDEALTDVELAALTS